jgi:hypothetical protein
MKMVAILIILALLLVAFAPSIDLTNASLALMRPARHAIRNFARPLRPAASRLTAFATLRGVIEDRPPAKVAASFPLYDIDCTWLC